MDAADALECAKQALLHWPTVTGPPLLVMQRENMVFKVDTRDGPHALRMHRAGYHREPVINSELEWMAMLSEQGFVVPRPALTISGILTAHATCAGGAERIFSLLSWLPGEPFGASHKPLQHLGQRRADLMRRMGERLAELHGHTDSWKPSSRFQRPHWDRDGLVGPQPFWGRFWESEFLSDEDRAWLCGLREECSEALAAYDSAGADHGLIHADLARENILVDGAEIYFIDFDDCGFGYRVFDLATALIKNIHEPDYNVLRDAFLQGYLRMRPLHAVDINALPLMMLLRSLSYLGWVNERRHEPGMAEKAKRFFADVKYLSANRH